MAASEKSGKVQEENAKIYIFTASKKKGQATNGRINLISFRDDGRFEPPRREPIPKRPCRLRFSPAGLRQDQREDRNNNDLFPDGYDTGHPLACYHPGSRGEAPIDGFVGLATQWRRSGSRRCWPRAAPQVRQFRPAPRSCQGLQQDPLAPV